MIEKLKLPEIYKESDTGNDIVLHNKINEIIDKVNALEKAVKQCDRPMALDI